MTTLPVSAIHVYGAGLNIEGGYPYLRMLVDHNWKNHNLIWANIILVLDRPLIDNVVFDEILNDDRYPLLENRIEEINEHHFMSAFLMIMQYYVENCHSLLGRDEKKSVKITVHLHQDVKRIELLDILDRHLEMLIKVPHTVALDYITDTPTYVQTKTDYSSTDILLSFSQCAGLDPRYQAGDLLVADTFIQYSIDDSTINTRNEYKVPNHLISNLDKIVQSPYNQMSVDHVNSNYISHNLNRHDRGDKAHYLTRDDFHHVKMLHVDKLWNPKDKNESVNIL
jgi:hypothetical protein